MSATEIGLLVSAIIGVMSMLATMTPNKSHSRVIQMILDIINAAAMNMGRSKNAD
jgi:hypothetical protein